MDKKQIAEAVIKKCFWDYRISPDEIIEIAEHGNNTDRIRLLTKIIMNDSDISHIMCLFSTDVLAQILPDIKLPLYSPNDRPATRLATLKMLILGIKPDIPRLRWGR